MKKAIPVLSILAIAITSCGQPATLAPAPTPTRARPTGTSTSRTPALLSQATTLYSGPGNLAYERLASLPAGAEVYPSGTYGDFVQVGVSVAGTEATGYVWQGALQDIPIGLPELDRLQVPWEPFFDSRCAPGKYEPASDSVTFASVSADEGFYTHSAVWKVTAPIRIQIQSFAAKGSTWSNESSSAEWSDVKVYGSTDFDIRSRADGGTYEIDIHQSVGGDVAKAIEVGQSSSGPIQVLFDQPADGRPIGTIFSVLDKIGTVLTTVDLTSLPEVSLPNGLFPDGKLYFGTDTMANSALIVAGLRIGSQPTGDWVDEASVSDYLNGARLSKAAEGRDVTIGSDFMFDHAIDRRYCQIMARDFNLAMLSDFSWPSFWPDQAFSTDYHFGSVDRAVDFAVQHGWRVRGSHLVWGAPESLPDWLLASNYTRDQYISILENHIRAVAGHFRGRVQEWNVANEAIERILCNDDSYYDFWYRKIGPGYIKRAFRAAREADPNAILILNNEYDFSYSYPPAYACLDPTVKTIEATVKDLNAEGRLVDVVGMEMHLYDDPSTVPPAVDVVGRIMLEFAGLGVRVYITEMDVNLAYIQDHYPTPQGPYAFQAGVYADMLNACLGLPERACGSFTTMGIGDSMSWIVDSCTGCMNEPNAAPLMFDDNFLPKQAYFAVRDALSGTAATATPNP